jgi:hypothetical protein
LVLYQPGRNLGKIARMIGELTVDNELFELCKEVYEKTGWEDTHQEKWFYNLDGKTGVFNTIRLNDTEPDFHSLSRIAPLYTSDYLLEKLPIHVGVEKGSAMMGEAQFYCAYKIYHKGTPLEYKLNAGDKRSAVKALLKLTLALHAAGELNV